jgi:hypothetical protein
MSKVPKDRVLSIQAREDESKDNALSRTLIRPTLNSALSIEGLNRLGKGHQHNINTLVDELGTQIEAVNKGDMSRPEALLIAQAHTLDALFGRLLDASVKNMGEYLGATESYMRLSLKAQSQCAQTIRVLNELKSPKNVAFIQQANLANGHQQVNNYPARKNENEQNELLERAEHEQLEFGAQKETFRANSTVETMGEIDRPKKRTRKD